MRFPISGPLFSIAVSLVLARAAPSFGESLEIAVSECMVASYSYTATHPGLEPRREWQSGWMVFRCESGEDSLVCDVENQMSGKVTSLPMKIVERRQTHAGDVLRAENVSPANKRNHVLTLNLSSGRAIAHIYEPALETYYDAVCHGTFRARDAGR